MGTIAITGSAGGIGAATRGRLEANGHRVIGVDVREAEVIADLSSAEGRAEMVGAVERACDGVLDGLVVGAGIFEAGDAGLVVAINYFGAIATLEGLRPLLARGANPSAVAISSNSTTTQPALALDIVEACLSGDEAEATRRARANSFSCYPSSKMALAHWVRRHSGRGEWIGAGIRLNAIAPGLILTPMTEAMADSVLQLGEVFPIPIGRAGQPGEVADLLAYGGQLLLWLDDLHGRRQRRRRAQRRLARAAAVSSR
jgi:NAD(P)-dependent dehydrogenase (short-subunit alcohol dehydrogenase family)